MGLFVCFVCLIFSLQIAKLPTYQVAKENAKHLQCKLWGIAETSRTDIRLLGAERASHGRSRDVLAILHKARGLDSDNLSAFKIRTVQRIEQPA